MKEKPLHVVMKEKVIGRKIVRVILNRFPTGVAENPYAYNPVFVLDDGTTIHFVAQETDVGEYGVFPAVHKYQQ